MRPQYSMVTDWYIEGKVDEVADVLGDAEGYVRWWPSACLGMTIVDPGYDDTIGQIVDVCSRGWLPYTLRGRATVTESQHPYGFTIRADGDFVGEGVWTLRQEGDHVHVQFTWNVSANKSLLRYFTFLLRPIFSANHGWAMRQDEESSGENSPDATPSPHAKNWTSLCHRTRGSPVAVITNLQ